ncbi:MAG: AAA family ATPase [Nitrospiraceae bacterium]|nr:AAA family ATPase [Nitrospiraceae bacterium]
MNFKDMLGNEETVFKDPIVLDYDYIPKFVPYRESEQREIILSIKPLFQRRNGKNLFLYGKPGIGKTLLCKSVLKELEDNEQIFSFYINCWKKNTTYKIALQLADELNYPFVQNKKTDEILSVIKRELNKKSAVFILDEADKLEDVSFLYFLLEEIYRKTIILITNGRQWIIDIDSRVRSRLLPQLVEVKPYDINEVRGILKERLKYAFYPDVFEEAAFELVVEKAYKAEDVRVGLYLLKEAGNNAEERASKKIQKEDVINAINKLRNFSIKDSSELDEDTRLVLKITKENSGRKIGDLYKIYQSKGGKSVYKTFQRKIIKLEKAGFLKLKKIIGGAEGTTTIINYAYKDLNDFN